MKTTVEKIKFDPKQPAGKINDGNFLPNARYGKVVFWAKGLKLEQDNFYSGDFSIIEPEGSKVGFIIPIKVTKCESVLTVQFQDYNTISVIINDSLNGIIDRKYINFLSKDTASDIEMFVSQYQIKNTQELKKWIIEINDRYEKEKRIRDFCNQQALVSKSLDRRRIILINLMYHKCNKIEIPEGKMLHPKHGLYSFMPTAREFRAKKVYGLNNGCISLWEFIPEFIPIMNPEEFEEWIPKYQIPQYEYTYTCVCVSPGGYISGKELGRPAGAKGEDIAPSYQNFYKKEDLEFIKAHRQYKRAEFEGKVTGMDWGQYHCAVNEAAEEGDENAQMYDSWVRQECKKIALAENENIIDFVPTQTQDDKNIFTHYYYIDSDNNFIICER